MENTAPDSDLPRMPNERMVYPSSGKPFTETEIEFQNRLAENKTKTQALVREVDQYWQWLREAEPIKLTKELAVEDLFSVILGYLMDERKVLGSDIINTVKRCIEESRK